MISGSLVWLSGLAVLVARAAAAAAGDDVVTSETFFYGQSPAVYPSPEMTGGSEWATAHGKAKALVAKISLLERVSLTGGAFSKTGCSGTIAPIPRLNFSGMCLSDSGNGLRNTDIVNAYPAGCRSSRRREALTRKRGAAMGGEFGRKGLNVFLGPVVGPAGRIVRGGRNWEGFSTDPYLSSCLAARTIEGVQSEGVQTSLKHFIANEQELNRRPVLGAEAVSSNDPNLDDRTMHEALSGWRTRWHRRTANVMCSYQRVNNSYGCANSKTLNGLLKTELGFQGFVVSDWDAQRAGVAAALAGMDMAMPSPAELWGKYLVEAVKNGSVPESQVTDMAASVLEPHEPVEGRDRKDRPAVEGHVLVKNTKGALLLRFPRSISVFGYSARSARGPAPAADVLAPSADDEVSLDMWRYGQTSICVGQAVEGLLGNAQPAATKGTLMGGGGSGGSTPAVFVSSHDALSRNSSRAVKLLYGEASPSGKFPYTLARNASDYGHLLSPDEPARRFQNFSQSDFTEGVYLDYKYFDKYNVTPRPRYEFGFGLSYTIFELSHLKIQTQSQSTGGSGSGSGNTGDSGEWPTGPIVPGGQADLFDTIAQGSVRVRNTGEMAAGRRRSSAAVCRDSNGPGEAAPWV
ncbi:probable beta-glucosidase precursor [Claviceps purpurea 20.1]|uniref:Beta-glucosidase cel3A n=1 Tax=Claviceps purpurea (strain 20.1) TaxID=1111077 RepID=M1W8W5_CLAP2|nr:probable beta-glucosidase precursor [Claviceps purpurea 20.1]